MLEPTTAQAVAVALHELATNAAKYGPLSAENGHVDLKCPHDANGRLSLRWTETGGPPVPQKPTRKGFGGRIIGQLKGENRSAFGPRPAAPTSPRDCAASLRTPTPPSGLNPGDSGLCFRSVTTCSILRAACTRRVQYQLNNDAK
jgi:hypothetical protein